MTFNTASLLCRMYNVSATLEDDWLDCATEAIVSDLPLSIEFAALHIDLKSRFAKVAPNTQINLQDALLFNDKSLQECRISFSKPIDSALAETTIHRGLEKQYCDKGLLFDRHSIHIILANI